MSFALDSGSTVRQCRDMMCRMHVSVLIIVHERPAHLRACLRALAIQTVPPTQVVVVDDGCSPPSAARIRQYAADAGIPVTLVPRVRDGYCPAAVRNEAVRHAACPYLLFLDCDILPFPDVIERHLDMAHPGRFLRGHCYPLDAARSAPFLERVDWGRDALEQAWGGDMQQWCDAAARRFDRQALMRRIGLARRHKPKLLSGHFSLFREALVAVNGFDEHYIGWGYEDDDLCVRLYRSGLRVRSMIREARAFHLYHPPAKPESRRCSPNRRYFRRRHVAIRCEAGIARTQGGS